VQLHIFFKKQLCFISIDLYTKYFCTKHFSKNALFSRYFQNFFLILPPPPSLSLCVCVCVCVCVCARACVCNVRLRKYIFKYLPSLDASLSWSVEVVISEISVRNKRLFCRNLFRYLSTSLPRTDIDFLFRESFLDIGAI